MANAIAPYLNGSKWTIDVDPDDINFIVWDVTKDLSDRSTSASGVSLIPNGITAQQGPTIQGTVVIALIKMNAGTVADRSGTMRITCANGEQFDRTIYFNTEDH